MRRAALRGGGAERQRRGGDAAVIRQGGLWPTVLARSAGVLAYGLHVEHHAAILMTEEVAMHHISSRVVGEERLHLDIAIPGGDTATHRLLTRDSGAPLVVPRCLLGLADTRTLLRRFLIAENGAGRHIPGLVDGRQTEGVHPNRGVILDKRHVLVVDDAPLLIEEEGIDVNVEGVVWR